MSNPISTLRVFLPVLALAFVLATFQPACAQVSAARDTTTSAVAMAAAAENPSPADLATTAIATPKVTGVNEIIELNDIARVTVTNLKEWSATNDPAKLVPFIDGRAIRGNYPEEVHPRNGRLFFHLKIKPENTELWTDLLGAPGSIRRPVRFSVGLEDRSPFETVYDESNPVQMVIISPVYGVIAAIVALLTLVLFIRLARKTSIIRDPGSDPGCGRGKAYNLGRTQMAFWFFLIYVSYLVIWLVTDRLDTITASLLGLMGISAGTALSEALIDSGKNSARLEQRRGLWAERQALEQTVADLQSRRAALELATPSSPDDLSHRDGLDKEIQQARMRIAQIEQQLSSLESTKSARPTRGFLRDVMADRHGYSFHRFQIFAWTIVLGIMFMSSVYNNLSMPEFSATLLGLMGLSSGTYIGFKFPEKQE